MKINISKSTWLFLALAFGIAWLTALFIFLTGGLANSPEIIPGSGVTLALALLATIYMAAPAMAHIITRVINRTGWKNLNLRPNFKIGWPYLLAGYFLPALFTILGAVIFFFLFSRNFDPGLTFLTQQLDASGINPGTVNPWGMIALQVLSSALIAPLLNILATFGEEFGWRSFLLPRLTEQLGIRRGLIATNIIWGVWHWPVILMGHNYGFDYFGYPWTGLLMTLWFTLSVGIFFSWLSIKGKSVWPAVLAHGALNGIASLGLFFTAGKVPVLLGPTPVGLIGMLPFTLVSLLILAKIKPDAPQHEKDAQLSAG